MFSRAPLFFIKVTNTLKTRSVFSRHECIQGNISNALKKNAFTARPIQVQRKSFVICKFTSFSLAIIGSKSLCFNKVVCEQKEVKTVVIKNDNFGWKDLLHFIYLDIWQWLGAIAAAFFVAYINVPLPLYLGDVVNFITNIRNYSDINFYDMPILKLATFYVAQAAGTFLYISLISSAGEKLASRLKINLYENIMKQDIELFDTRRTGELLDCMFTDVQDFKSSFKECASQGLKNVLQICGCTISLFSISTKMTVIFLCVVPSIIVLGSFFGRQLRKISRAAQNQSMKVFTISEEVLSNIRTVRSFSNENLECDKFNMELEKASSLHISLGYSIGLFQAGTNLFLNGLVLGTLLIGSQCVLYENLSPGYLMSFLVTAQMIQKSFAQLSVTFGHFLKGRQAFERICHLSSLQPNIPISGGIKIPHHTFVPSVEFKNVSFSYPTRPTQMILHDLSLILPAGKTVAVVGASGNGKSTMALLLERFYDVNQGSIKICDVDIRKLDPHWLRGTAIAIISQEPVLFASTIIDNIKYGNPNATDDEVFEAARQANADSFIRSFPDGYETIVGERGIAISGGQKQRIAIARALIKKPSILILDEATSALDAESEKIVQEALDRACKGRTVLIIAHRLSTVRHADIIAVLNKGVIVEMGSHESLIHLKGAYYKMILHQNESKSIWRDMLDLFNKNIPPGERKK